MQHDGTSPATPRTNLQSIQTELSDILESLEAILGRLDECGMHSAAVRLSSVIDDLKTRQKANAALLGASAAR